MPRDRMDQKAIIGIALFLFALFSLLIAQFFQLQITEEKKWSAKGRMQHYLVLKEPFHRGTFYANTGLQLGHPQKEKPLVLDVLKYHLYADPSSIPEEVREEICAKIAEILHLDAAGRDELHDHLSKTCRSRKVAMWVEQEDQEALLKWWKGFARKNGIARNALYFQSDYQRSYPFGRMLGQVLHTVQSVKDERTGQALPTGGLELYFNKYLQGKKGERVLMRSPRNALEVSEIKTVPENGADIYLTVNDYLQAVVEEELMLGVKRANAKGGWAIMMSPHTGEIYALAQYPFFYPPDYRRYFNQPEEINNTRVKAITDANEPGSIMKPVTLAIALMANEELKKRGELPLFSVDEKVSTGDGHFPGRARPIVDTHPVNYLNFNMAMQFSSNIYCGRMMQRVVDRLGPEWYRSVLVDVFKFGERTHIELPGETPGVVPNPGRLHPNGKLEWSVPTPFSLAMGHNIQTSSLQIIRAYAILASGGKLVQPTLIRKIVKKMPDGSHQVLVDRTNPEFKQVLDPLIVSRVVDAMRFTTMSGGTATRGNVPGFTEACKTGTARKLVDGEYTTKKHLATFVGFTPVKDPAFVLLVSIDEPEVRYVPGVGNYHHGGVCAATVFKEIAKRSLEYLGIEPDDPYGYPVGDPRYDPEKAVWVKEARALKEKCDSWNNSVRE